MAALLAGWEIRNRVITAQPGQNQKFGRRWAEPEGEARRSFEMGPGGKAKRTDQGEEEAGIKSV
jgi:hypothetical protein